MDKGIRGRGQSLRLAVTAIPFSPIFPPASWNPLSLAREGGIAAIAKRMKKVLLILVAILLTGTAFAETKRFEIPLEGSPSIGPQNAPVTVVEFIDYQ